MIKTMVLNCIAVITITKITILMFDVGQVYECVFICVASSPQSLAETVAARCTQRGSLVIKSIFLGCPSYFWDLPDCLSLGVDTRWGFFFLHCCCLPLPVGSLQSELWILSTSRRLKPKGGREAACRGGETWVRGRQARCAHIFFKKRKSEDLFFNDKYIFLRERRN